MNEPNQRAVSALPKILAAAAALGVGGRLAVSAGGMAPKSLTDVNASKSVLSMPDVNLLSSAERQRKIEERRIIEQDLSQLLSRNFAAQSKTAAFPYLPELIAGSALTAGGLALANSPKKYEDSVSGRLTNSVRPVYPDAIDGARGELDRAKDIKGTFLGQYAKSLAGVPWFYPAAAIAGSAGLTGGYKLTDAIVKKRAKMKREKALSKARKQFEDILLLEQGLGKKVGSALDEFCNAVESHPQFGKTASPIEGYLGILGAATVLGGLGGLATGYSTASQTERLAALKRAREIQLARRREDETRVRLVSPNESSIFLNNNSNNSDTQTADENVDDEQFQSRLNEGKFGSMNGVPDWNFERLEKNAVLWEPLLAGLAAAGYGGYRLARPVVSRLGSAVKNVWNSPYTKYVAGYGAVSAPLDAAVLEGAGALTGIDSIRPTRWLKGMYRGLQGENTDPNYTRHRQWAGINPEGTERSALDRVGHMFNTAVGRGNWNEYVPTFTYQKTKNPYKKQYIKPQSLNPNAVAFSDPSVALQRMTNKALRDYKDPELTGIQRRY